MKTNIEIFELTKVIHKGETDNSLSDRIMSNKYYNLIEIDLETIDTCGFSIDYNKAEEYSKLNTNAEPIILDSTGMLIDGLHRIEAAKIKGKETIMAYIGKQ